VNFRSVPSYTQVNMGFRTTSTRAANKRHAEFDVVNVFDKIYEIRDGSGIGVFAPQFGPRRVSLSASLKSCEGRISTCAEA